MLSAHSDTTSLVKLKLDTRSPTYSDYLMYVVYTTIDSNPNVTMSNLLSVLVGECLYDETQVKAAISALVYDYEAVWRRQIHNSYGRRPTHLTMKKSLPAAFKEWLGVVVHRNPELVSFSAPQVNRNGQTA